MKCYVRVKGDIGNVAVLAPEAQSVNWVVTYDHDANGSWLIVFAANPKRLPMKSFDDIAGMQEALQPLLPGVEVESIVGWDWSNDPHALGTWCIYRPGQLAQVLPELRTTEGRLFFASGDSSESWRSFIDGAIESGYHSARHVDEYLTAAGHQTLSPRQAQLADQGLTSTSPSRRRHTLLPSAEGDAIEAGQRAGGAGRGGRGQQVVDSVE
nr:hypothetical protein GCM10020092_080650 [Actinoplanes digitatis]